MVFAALAVGASAAAAAPTARHASAGTITAYLENDTANGTTNKIIIGGAFADYGTAHKGVVTLQKGTFKVDTSKVKTKPKVNLKECEESFTTTGPVTLSDGTGAYSGIAGTLQIKGFGIVVGSLTKTGKCNTSASAPAVASETFITATGKVTF
jgi:hypothetical protein